MVAISVSVSNVVVDDGDPLDEGTAVAGPGGGPPVFAALATAEVVAGTIERGATGALRRRHGLVVVQDDLALDTGRAHLDQVVAFVGEAVLAVRGGALAGLEGPLAALVLQLDFEQAGLVFGLASVAAFPREFVDQLLHLGVRAETLVLTPGAAGPVLDVVFPAVALAGRRRRALDLWVGILVHRVLLDDLDLAVSMVVVAVVSSVSRRSGFRR